MDSSTHKSDTSRHTASIKIILTLHVCADAMCARALKVRTHTDVWMHPSVSVRAVCMRVWVWGRLWMIDSGVIYYSTVTSISKSEATVHPWLSLSLSLSPSLILSLSFLSRSGDSHKRLLTQPLNPATWVVRKLSVMRTLQMCLSPWQHFLTSIPCLWHSTQRTLKPWILKKKNRSHIYIYNLLKCNFFRQLDTIIFSKCFTNRSKWICLRDHFSVP